VFVYGTKPKEMIAKLAEKNDWKYVFGEENDMLGRTLKAVDKFNVEIYSNIKQDPNSRDLICYPNEKLVNLDKDKIKEVLLHILLNSIESMKKGGGIEIDVYTVKDSGDLAIEIKDSGEGIHPDNIKRVFHPFFTTKEGRVGLGLTVVRQIIQAHKGTVNLKSEQGKGTEILITIPFTPGDLASCEDFGGS